MEGFSVEIEEMEGSGRETVTETLAGLVLWPQEHSLSVALKQKSPSPSPQNIVIWLWSDLDLDSGMTLLVQAPCEISGGLFPSPPALYFQLLPPGCRQILAVVFSEEP